MKFPVATILPFGLLAWLYCAGPEPPSREDPAGIQSNRGVHFRHDPVGGSIPVPPSTTGPAPRRFFPIQPSEISPTRAFTADRAIPSGSEPASHDTLHPKVRERFTALPIGQKIDALPERFRGLARRYRRELSTLDPEHWRYLCWAPGTPGTVIATFRELEREGGLAPGEPRTLATQFLGPGRWDRTATDGGGIDEQGRPTRVTWSIVPDGTSTPDVSDDPNGPSNLRGWLAGIYGGSPSGAPEEQPWFGIFTEAFESLEAQTGLSFTYQPSDDGAALSGGNPGNNTGDLIRGDIRIAARNLDGDGGTLGFAYAPNFGDLVLDSGDSFFNSTSSRSVRLFNILTHEIGHTLGLDHVCPANRTKLMEPTIALAFRGPQFDDFYSLQRQYGDALEISAPGEIDNDTAARATPLDPAADPGESRRWLSLDGIADIDYFRFAAASGQTVSAQVIPSDPFGGTYLEGPQNFDGECSEGTAFDPRNRRDLSLELLDSDGVTVLAAAGPQPAGQTESLPATSLPGAGDYFLRVTGDSTDFAQLYEIEITLETPLPAAEIAVGDTRLDAESNVPSNQIIDPSETVRLAIPIANTGNLTATNLSPGLVDARGLTKFSSSGSIASLPPGEQTEWLATFALEGDCGETRELTLEILGDDGLSESFGLPIALGALASSTPIDEGFDAGPALPDPWITASSGAGQPWTVVTNAADSGPRSAFAATASRVGTSALVSPAQVLGTAGGQLEFRHQYQLESGFDGSVLEVSLDGGPWIDLVTHPDTAVVGGYNENISDSFGSPIGGRDAWSGNSGGFVAAEITLPPAWAGMSLRFRWLTASDESVAEIGWWVDSVALRTETLECQTFRPALSLDTVGTTLIRGAPPGPTALTLLTPLPLDQPVTVAPEFTGEAGPDDLVGWTGLTLPAGQTSITVALEAAADPAPGGDLDLTFTLPADSPEFAAVEPASASFLITDSAFTYAAWRDLFPGLDPGQDADSDHDGAPDLLEYAFDTNPLDPADSPEITSETTADALRLHVPAAPVRADLSITAETSSDLFNWTTDGVTPTTGGYIVPRDGAQRFLRLKVQLDEP